MNKKLLTATVSDSDPPMFSFQKFYVNGTKATNFSPIKSAFGIPTLQLETVSWAPEWGLDLRFRFEGMDELIPNRPLPNQFEIWIEGWQRPWLPDIGTWNGQVWVSPDGGPAGRWEPSDYYKWGILHCSWVNMINHSMNGQSSVNCDYQNKRRRKTSPFLLFVNRD